MSWFSHFWSSFRVYHFLTVVHVRAGRVNKRALRSSWAAATSVAWIHPPPSWDCRLVERLRFIYSFPVWTTNEKTTQNTQQQQQQEEEKGRVWDVCVVYPGTCPEIDSSSFDLQLMKNDGLGNVLLLGHMVVRPSPMSLTNNFRCVGKTTKTHLASTKTLHTCQSGNVELVDIYFSYR